MISKETILHEASKSLARKKLQGFVSYTFPKYEFTDFHKNYCSVLQAFADGNIKKLIVSAPPQHGKSELSTRRLPAYLFGKNPDIKIAIGSYNTTLARKFNRDIQRIITDTTYSDIFPLSQLNGKNIVTVDNFLKNSDEFEIVGSKGGLKAVGRGSGLTGFTVDISILDDIYKDLQEGNSPVVRESAWDWYTSVIRTRLHNDSQELIVFTRWNADDIIGRIQKTEKTHVLTSLDEIDEIDKDTWIIVNFEAIKDSPKTDIDKREIGDALYPQKHSVKKLLEAKNLDSEVFDCLYQGNPISKKGLLYANGFKTYDSLPQATIRKNYTDTADKGKDWLCSITYDVGHDGNIYVVDMVYSDEAMERTEIWVAEMIKRTNTKHVDIESNNGGRGFARYLENNTNAFINAFHQSNNKESRILSNSSLVGNKIHFPSDWKQRFSHFYEHISKFKKQFNANATDDGADCLTGIIEMQNKDNNIGIIW